MREIFVAGRVPARRTRGIAGSLLALVAVAALAAPAGAYSVQITEGNTGVVSITDEAGSPGVTCRFHNEPGSGTATLDGLERITVKGIYVHHPAAVKRYVGYRFKVTRKTTASVLYLPVHTSPIVKKLASATEPAFFASRSFTFANPVANNGARYRIELELIWYGKNGTTVTGRTVGTMQHYKHVQESSDVTYTLPTSGETGHCRANFHFA